MKLKQINLQNKIDFFTMYPKRVRQRVYKLQFFHKTQRIEH